MTSRAWSHRELAPASAAPSCLLTLLAFYFGSDLHNVAIWLHLSALITPTCTVQTSRQAGRAPPAQRLMTGSWSKQVAGEQSGASSKSRIHVSTQLLMVTKLKPKGERNMVESCCFSVTNLGWQHRRLCFLRSCRKLLISSEHQEGFWCRLKTGL